MDRASPSRASAGRIPPLWGGFLPLPENRSALMAVRALSRSLLAGRRIRPNPLVLHGPAGAGKTRLATELLRALSEAEEVLTGRIAVVGDLARTPDALDDPDLLACDLLVLEDLSGLPARNAEALSELLDQRLSRRRAVLATARSGPASLRHLPRKLTSRLAAGLVVQLEPLSAGSRRALLDHVLRTRQLELTSGALDWLAGQSAGSGIRPLLGLVENIAQAAKGSPGPFDRLAVQDMLAAAGTPPVSRDVSRIVRQVAEVYGASMKEIVGPSRLRKVLIPRQVAMYLARELCGLSLPKIGAAFGGRDHSTVLHACRKVEAHAALDPVLANLVRQLRAELE